MATEPIKVTSNELGIQNPQRSYGTALLIYGGILAALTLTAILVLLSSSLKGFNAFATCLTAGLAGLVGLWLLYLGLKARVSFFVQAGAPEPLFAYRTVLPTLLTERIILYTYGRPSFFQALLHQFTPRYTYLTPPLRYLVDGLLHRVWQVVVVLGLFILLLVLAGNLAPIVLGVVLLLTLVLALIVHSYTLTVSTTTAPNTELSENAFRLTQAGDPIGLFLHAVNSLGALRIGKFPNRELMKRAPEIGEGSGSNKFEAELLVESQPIPLPGASTTPENALILEVAGVFLGCGGWGLLLFFPFFTGTYDKIAAAFTGMVGISLGGHFLAMAQCLHNTFRFRSDVFWIQMSGSYMVSEIGLGDGRGGGVMSRRKRFQSDIHVVVHATRLVTECTSGRLLARWTAGQSGTARNARFQQQTLAAEEALQTPRYVVDANPLDQDFQQRLQYLIQQLLVYRDEGGQLAGINLADPNFNDLVTANLQIAQLTRQVETIPALPAPPNRPSLGAAPPPIYLEPPEPVDAPSELVLPIPNQQVPPTAPQVVPREVAQRIREVLVEGYREGTLHAAYRQIDVLVAQYQIPLTTVEVISRAVQKEWSEGKLH